MNHLAFRRDEPTVIDFGDHLRWVEVSSIEVTPTHWLRADPGGCMSSMLSSVAYRDSFLGTESWKADPGPVHGPYRTEALSVSDFVAVERAVFSEAIGDWLNGRDRYDSAAPLDRATRIHEALAVIPTSASCFRLVKELDGADHEWSFALWDFAEWVFLDAEEGKIWLVVWAAD